MPAAAPQHRPPARRRRLLPLVLLGLTVRALRKRAPEPPAPPLPGQPRLTKVVGGSRPHGAPPQPAEVLLRSGRTVLGRARDADLHLPDLTVSPRHALIEADAQGRVHIRDLGALNGVRVDGVPVAHVELHDGNRVQLGDVQLVYRTDPRRDTGGRSGGELGENAGR